MAKNKQVLWILTLSNNDVIMFCSDKYILHDQFMIGREYDVEQKTYNDYLTWINPAHIIKAEMIQED